MATWKMHPEFTDYEVSDEGQVRRRTAGHWTKPGRPRKFMTNEDGYYRVTLFKDGKALNRFVHVLVLETFVGPCPPGHETAHGNGVCNDNRLANLSWETPKVNHSHKHLHGTMAVGEKNGAVVLTEEQVEFARQRRRQGFKIVQIAKKLGVSSVTLGKAIRGTNWKHLR